MRQANTSRKRSHGPVGQEAPPVDSAPAAQAATPIRFVPQFYFQLQEDIN